MHFWTYVAKKNKIFYSDTLKYRVNKKRTRFFKNQINFRLLKQQFNLNNFKTMLSHICIEMTTSAFSLLSFTSLTQYIALRHK